MSIQRVVPVNEEVREVSKLRARRLWEARNAYARDWLDQEHDFVLMRGDDSTGRKMRMTGREAKRLNYDYEKTFIKALDTNPAARMYRWKWNDPMPEGQKVIKGKGRPFTW